MTEPESTQANDRLLPPDYARYRVIWYQLMYGRAAYLAHGSIQGKRKGKLVLGAASPELLNLARQSAARGGPTMTPAASRAPVADPLDELDPFLRETSEPLAAILLAGLLTLSLQGDDETPPVLPSDASVKQIESRQTLLAIAHEALDGKVVAPSSTAVALVEYGLRGDVTHRVHYNAACFYAGVTTSKGAALTRALDELTTALREAPPDQRGELARWADADPSLRLLRTVRERRFNEIVQKYTNPSLERKVVPAATPAEGAATTA